jgi:hypothetical protein
LTTGLYCVTITQVATIVAQAAEISRLTAVLTAAEQAQANERTAKAQETKDLEGRLAQLETQHQNTQTGYPACHSGPRCQATSQDNPT